MLLFRCKERFEGFGIQIRNRFKRSVFHQFLSGITRKFPSVQSISGGLDHREQIHAGFLAGLCLPFRVVPPHGPQVRPEQMSTDGKELRDPFARLNQGFLTGFGLRFQDFTAVRPKSRCDILETFMDVRQKGF